MALQAIDLAIIGAYLLATIIIGLVLKRRASKNLDSYLLGGKTLPWYMLSLSNASGMFDISGTMWLVAMMFIYGLKSIYIPWLWPVFNQVFLMVFLSMWLRRSGVITGAEWIRFRFGDDLGGRLSHAVIVFFAIVSVLGFLAYGFVGIGKFMEIFIPWSAVAPYVPFDLPQEYVPHFYGILFTAIATFYVMLGGMLSIVWADVLQFTIMTVSALIIGFIAIDLVSHDEVMAAVPNGWSSTGFGWNLGLDWDVLIPQVSSVINDHGFELFGAMMMMMIFKGVLVSAAGPAPNYDMQKILATKSPKEAALMSGFVSVILIPVRYLMISGFCVLALVYFSQLNIGGETGNALDLELVLPNAILKFAPVGIIGLILAGLLAAFMSTFASTVNAAPAYLVNDVYKRYINPEASAKKLVYMSYVVSILVVVISTLLGLVIKDINQILQYIVSGLWGGYTITNVLKWYWWRFNGMGYFIGMVAGLASAIPSAALIAYFYPGTGSLNTLYAFPIVLVLSGIGAMVGTYLFPADDMTRLKEFYRRVRPWGFWDPVHQAVLQDDPDYIKNPNFKRDSFNIVVGIILQTAIVALPMYFVIQDGSSALISAVICIVAALVLYQTWYKNLRDTPEEEMELERSKAKPV